MDPGNGAVFKKASPRGLAVSKYLSNSVHDSLSHVGLNGSAWAGILYNRMERHPLVMEKGTSAEKRTPGKQNKIMVGLSFFILFTIYALFSEAHGISFSNRHANKVTVKILPLGASITWGQLSSTGNGYRQPLREKLIKDGWNVDMVGSKHNGKMEDNVSIAQEMTVWNTH